MTHRLSAITLEWARFLRSVPEPTIGIELGACMYRRLVILAPLVLVAVLAAGCTQGSAVSADGEQVIRVSAQGTFAPETTAKAGQPIRLEFGQGDGCTAAIKFDQLGIFEDLTDGGGVVQLPALEAGRYPLICQSDMDMGTLVVE